MGGAGKEGERRRRVLDHAKQTGNVAKTCRYFGIGRASFYRWRQEYLKRGEPGLVPKRPGPKSHPKRTPDAVVEKVLHLRQTYHLGPMRIVWYLARYHDVGISDAGVYRILRRSGMSRLPGKVGRRAVHTTRYEKRVPGHHIQVDVKFLTFKDEDGAPIKRYQYTAIDDATRIRALKIYDRHNQANAIDFCQIDSCRLGGLNEVIVVLLMAAKFGVPVFPHAGGVGRIRPSQSERVEQRADRVAEGEKGHHCSRLAGLRLCPERIQ